MYKMGTRVKHKASIYRKIYLQIPSKITAVLKAENISVLVSTVSKMWNDFGFPFAHKIYVHIELLTKTPLKW